jgi:perosamine synthetase
MSIPFHKTHITQDEIDAVVEALKSGWTTMGPKTLEFERKFSEYIFNSVDSPIHFNTEFLHAVSLNSATAALHLALKAIGLKKNDEVILPTNTFIATAEVVTYFDAKPVLCDIDYDTHNIDVSKIEALITDKTKAIIPVHFAGQPCDMNEISTVAGKYNLKIIEDAAHALPSTYQGLTVGLMSDITCFSFYATKTLSTGEGGMATTKNPDYAKSMRINRLHGISKDAWNRYSKEGSWIYDVVDNGNKYNTTDLHASLGVVQLGKLEWMYQKRLVIAQKYISGLKDNKNIVLPVIKKDRSTSWHLFVIKIKNNRDAVIQKLKENDIGCSVHFIPVHKMTYYKNTYNYQDKNYPIANQVFDETISLPIFPDMTEEQVDKVIEVLNG